MEAPPPVPPKDTPKGGMAENDKLHASGSKRKRHDGEDAAEAMGQEVSEDSHTPKRSRLGRQQSEQETSEDTTPANQRNLRRKKKMSNLSTLNSRHAPDGEPIRPQSSQQVRESKFQEGSLTDKPSEKPPSVFMRLARTDSGNIQQMDELMEGYNDNVDGQQESRSMDAEHQGATNPEQVTQTTVDSTPRQESSGFFGFGRSFVHHFHPFTLWNKMFAETKEELIRQAREEALRKQKAEAEARYAQMKAANQFDLQPVAPANLANSSESATLADSAVDVDTVNVSTSQARTEPRASTLLPPPIDEYSSQSGGDAPEMVTRPKATLKSRFFKKPSMPSLKDGLKRVRSELNLTATANTTNRESSSSVSPVKASYDDSTLRRSQSKFDLKRQHKLSKRVSDLEAKLQQARRDLDDALVEASPAPKLTNKYERFTPQSTVKRPKFVPGKLPSLPSERVLIAEQMGFGDDEASPVKLQSDVRPRPGMDLTEEMELDGGGATIKARPDQPRHKLSALFDPPFTDIFMDPAITSNQENPINDYSGCVPDRPLNMNPDSIIDTAVQATTGQIKDADYASLDAKLKALDKNIKPAAAAKKAPVKSKKRKSHNGGDKLFKPTSTTEDDDEDGWKGTPRKKRKSAGKGDGNSPDTKRTLTAAAKKSSPRGRKAANGVDKFAAGSNATNDPAIDDQVDAMINVPMNDTEHPDDTTAIVDAPFRNSLDSQGIPLEPVYEEDDEDNNGATPTVTKTSTNDNYPRFAGRSRSNSPSKLRRGFVQPGAEEQVITRAAEAAQDRREANGRVGSLPPTIKHADGTVEVEVATVEEIVMVVPPHNGISGLVNEAAGTEQSDGMHTGQMNGVGMGGKRSFEWPPDVF